MSDEKCQSYTDKEIKNLSNNLNKAINNLEKAFNKDLERLEKTHEKGIEQVQDEILTKSNFEFKTIQKNIENVDVMALKNHNSQENSINKVNAEIQDIKDRFEQNITELKECLTNVKNNKVWLTTLEKIVDGLNEKIDKIDRQNEVLRVDSENQNIYDRKLKKLDDDIIAINNILVKLKGITSESQIKNIVNYLTQHPTITIAIIIYLISTTTAMYHAVIDSANNKKWINNMENQVISLNKEKAKKYDELIKTKSGDNIEVVNLKKQLRDANLLIKDYEKNESLEKYDASIGENTQYFIESEK